MWVESWNTWSRLWLTISCVSPRSARCSIERRSPGPAPAGRGRPSARPSRRIDAPPCTARAMATPWRCPPDSVRASRRTSGMRIFRSAERGDRRPAHLGLRAEQPHRPERADQLAAEEQVLGDVAVVGEGEVLVHGGDAGSPAPPPGWRSGPPRRRSRGARGRGATAPHSILTSVDLPAPLSPTMAVTVPAGNSIETSRTAATPP